jgi:hypothetical protein
MNHHPLPHESSTLGPSPKADSQLANPARPPPPGAPSNPPHPGRLTLAPGGEAPRKEGLRDFRGAPHRTKTPGQLATPRAASSPPAAVPGDPRRPPSPRSHPGTIGPQAPRGGHTPPRYGYGDGYGDGYATATGGCPGRPPGRAGPATGPL